MTSWHAHTRQACQRSVASTGKVAVCAPCGIDLRMVSKAQTHHRVTDCRCKHFSKVNALLTKHGQRPIDWQL